MATKAISPGRLQAGRTPGDWSLEQIWPFVMATVGQRDELLRQNTGLQIQLYGGEFASERLGGLAQAVRCAWSPLILLTSVGSVAAGSAKLARDLGQNLAPAPQLID